MSKYFGELDYSPEAVFQFAAGIPGFDDQAAFVFLDQPQTHPLVFMQSLARVCASSRSPCSWPTCYVLNLSPEDRDLLGLAPPPQIGSDILCLALVTLGGADPTVNLASPDRPQPENHKGVQAIQECSGYSIRHPLSAAGGPSMLVMRRRAGEGFLIGPDIEIEILEVSPTRVKIGIMAPAALPIVRKEVVLTREENLAASRNAPPDAIAWLSRKLPWPG